MVLMACHPETQAPIPIIHKAASAPIAASEPTSAIVSQILNSPQEQDILASSKQAMENITASEVALVGVSAVAVASSAAVEVAEPTAPAVHLPETCERYYQRVDRCFAKQPENSEELRQMNQDARLDLVADKPTDKTCVALNESFNGVARNLGCE